MRTIVRFSDYEYILSNNIIVLLSLDTIMLCLDIPLEKAWLRA